MYQATYTLLFSLLANSAGLDHDITQQYEQIFGSYQECYTQMDIIGKAILSELDKGGIRAVFEFRCLAK
jgi:hypothetical protein